MTTKDLDYLLTLDLPTIAVDDTSPVVLLSDVPTELRSALDQYQFLAARPIINGAVCVWLSDWHRFLQRQILTLRASMHAQSLQDGLKGPSAEDLARASVLSNWLITRHGEEACLIGTPTGHPTSQGVVLRSSSLCGLDLEGRWARTISRWYALSNPVTTLQFMALHGPGATLVPTDVIGVAEALEIISHNRRNRR